MEKEIAGWREVWKKEADLLLIKVYYSDFAQAAYIQSWKIYFGKFDHWKTPEDRLLRFVKDYTEAIEWGQEIAEQWFTKYKLQQSKE